MEMREFEMKCEYWGLIQNILGSVFKISKELEYTPVLELETMNKFGDQQLLQDIKCDEIIEKSLCECELVRGFASEERPELMYTPHQDGKYIVTYDPVDGSSIIDTNFSVGSIFSIWPYTDKELIGEKVSAQTNALFAIYGPRTTVLLYNPEVEKVQEITLVSGGKWVLSRENLVIKEKTNIYCPGNLRSASENEAYNKVVNNWIKKGYTLRYTGGMVPDICQILVKGHGIFSALASPNFKPKLRVLYEVSAAGFLIEKSGGKSVTRGKKSILDY